MTQNIPDQAAYCGVYCGACPSYQISCNGCRSEDRNQKRTSKWGCKIRQCCFEEKNLKFCSQCNEFPCKKYRSKLSESHPNDKKFQYRHELPENLENIKKLGVKKWLKEQETKWQCPKCPGTVKFYQYQCADCGLKTTPTNQ